MNYTLKYLRENINLEEDDAIVDDSINDVEENSEMGYSYNTPFAFKNKRDKKNYQKMSHVKTKKRIQDNFDLDN